MTPSDAAADPESAVRSTSSDILAVATAKQAVGYLRTALASQRALTAGALLASAVGAALSLIPVLLLGRVVDEVRSGGDRNMLWQILIIVICAALGAALVSAIAESAMGIVIARLLADLRERAASAVLSLPVQSIERAGRGDAISRVGTDVAVLVSGARTAVPAILTSSVLIVVTLAGMVTLDWRLALAGLTAFPMYVMALRWYLPRSSPRYREMRVAEAEHLENLVGAVDGLPTVRAYGLQEEHRGRLATASARVRDISISVFSVMERFVARENRAEFVGLSVLVVAGWLLLRADMVTLGEVATATLLFHRLFNPIGAILFSFDEAQRSGAALTRLVGVIGSAGDGLPPRRPVPSNGGVSVRVRGLRHLYRETAVPAVDGVDLDIPAGSTLALVGRSGAGKTTIASLIAGTLALDASTSAGTVEFDGKVVDGDDIRDFVSVATQESHIFVGTLRENLLLAAPDATDDDLWRALSAVGVDEYVRRCPDGLDTVAGEGGFSVDPMRAQQISLARILLRDAPIVVLDESTAEAGSRGAADLEAAAAAVTSGRTALIVAHRLSQAAAADRIAVVDGGRIVESGCHDELVALGGRYARIWELSHSA